MKDRIDFLLLSILKEENATSSYLAMTIKEMPLQDIDRSIRSIQLHMKKLIKLNFVKEGLIEGHSRTYYITEVGLKELEV
ncbi:MAG: hypothetical protein HFI34_03240 [Lachnospiraceae bacterium]|nr:hypothetical protein [Lachnospiraceae bacterium]